MEPQRAARVAAAVGGTILVSFFGCSSSSDGGAVPSPPAPDGSTSAVPQPTGTGTTPAPTTPPPVTPPPKTEGWAKESVHPLRWTVPTDLGPLDDYVTIVESTDDGATWKAVGDADRDERYFRWTLPATGTHVRAAVEFHKTDLAGTLKLLRRVETTDVPLLPSQKKAYAWTKVASNAPFGPRDGAGGIVYAGKMWLIGGWNPRRFPLQTANDVWSSVDGATWVQERPNTFVDEATFPATDWKGRHAGGYVSYAGKMWIVGGDGNQGYYQNDVWSSTDGRTWTRTDNHTLVPRIDRSTGQPFPPEVWPPKELADYEQRTATMTGVFGGKLILAGGQRLNELVDPEWPGAPPKVFNDVWTSTDGASFRQVPAVGPVWKPRGWACDIVEHAGRAWLVGGALHDDPTGGIPTRVFFNDVWSTADGAAWEPVVSEPPFSGRMWHNVRAFDGRLWVINGFDGEVSGQGRLGGNLGDVWYSTDGVSWYEASPPAAFVPRHAQTAWVHAGALFVGSGNEIEEENWFATVWRMTPVP